VLLPRICSRLAVRQRTCWVAVDYEVASKEAEEVAMLGFG
jgi:hypothetical protein